MINKAILVGNLGQDPEIRHTPAGAQVTTFSVATTERYKDKSGQMVDTTEWHKIVTWNRLAEICGEYLVKGAKVYIEGKIKTRKWQDQEGNDKYTTEIVAHEMKMLGSKGDNNSGGGKQQDEPWPDNTYAPNDGTGDEVPF